MKQIILISLIALVISSCADAATKLDKKDEKVEIISEEEALKLLHSWTDFYLKGDALGLNEILDDSWKYSGSSDGRTTDKQATMEEFSNADYSFHSITYDDLEVNLYSDIAVIRGTEEMVIIGSSGTDTTKLALRFTDVYQKKNGKVKAIATHSSPID